VGAADGAGPLVSTCISPLGREVMKTNLGRTGANGKAGRGEEEPAQARQFFLLLFFFLISIYILNFNLNMGFDFQT
jgi:hypothetical protein